MTPSQHAKVLEALERASENLPEISKTRELCDEALSIMRAVQVGWQPIETAPKDGTDILVSNGKQIAAVYWWPMVWMGTTHSGMLKPTHWQPLPAPPTEHEVKP